MFNIGGGELLVILLIALIVLGPTKLPEAARQVGAVARELRRMSSSFQAELKSALDEPVEAAARERGHKVVSSEEQPAPTTDSTDGTDSTDSTDSTDTIDSTDGTDGAGGATTTPPSYPARSTAAAAGMYDVAPAEEPDTGADAAAEAPAADADGTDAAEAAAIDEATTARTAGMYDVAPAGQPHTDDAAIDEPTTARTAGMYDVAPADATGNAAADAAADTAAHAERPANDVERTADSDSPHEAGAGP